MSDMGKPTETELRQRVSLEMDVRDLSARDVAALSQRRMSHTTLSTWLNGRSTIGDKVRRGVAVAFGWPLDWPDGPPPVMQPDQAVTLADLRDLLSVVLERLERLGDQIENARRPTSPRADRVERRSRGEAR